MKFTSCMALTASIAMATKESGFASLQALLTGDETKPAVAAPVIKAEGKAEEIVA